MFCLPLRLGRRKVIALPLALRGVYAASRQESRAIAAGAALHVPATTARRGDRLAPFEAFMTTAMERLGVTGAAIAIVQDNEIVMVRGFGSRALDDPAPVTPDTWMMIDSLTKPMTSMMAATLVDDGLLTWDTPVRDLLPDFALVARDTGQPLTLADLFCGCAGVPRTDEVILFNAASLTPRRLIATATEPPVNAPVGARFQYTNHLYAVGGYAAAMAGDAATDLREAYRQAMRTRVLAPLGMSESTFELDDVLQRANYAIPSAPALTGELMELSLQGEEAFANAVEPAGGLWSTAREMSRFLLAQLGGGASADGARIVSTENLGEIWRTHVSIPANPNQPPVLSAATRGYGLGWFTGEYAGRRMLSHSGGVAGFVSEMALLPSERAGIAILTNGGSGAHELAIAAPLRFFELLLDQPPAVEALLAQQAAASEARMAEIAWRLGAIDADAVDPFLGTYRGSTLGDMTLTRQGDSLIFDAGEVRSALLPHMDQRGQPDGYLFVAPPLASLPVSLSLETEDGRPVVTLQIAGEGMRTHRFQPDSHAA